MEGYKPQEVSRDYIYDNFSSCWEVLGIPEYEPLGLFYAKDGDKYVAVDNSTGDGWAMEFGTLDDALEWLREAAEP